MKNKFVLAEWKWILENDSTGRAKTGKTDTVLLFIIISEYFMRFWGVYISHKYNLRKMRPKNINMSEKR